MSNRDLQLVPSISLITLLLICPRLCWGAGDHQSLPLGSSNVACISAPGQSAISAAIGRDQSIYHASPTAGGFRLENPLSRVAVDFTRRGIRAHSAGSTWSLKMAGFGVGGALYTTPPVGPVASGNRVEYRRGAVTEWYVNGPAGIEQGFTLAAPPAEPHAGPLTIELVSSGSVLMRLDSKG